MNYLLDALCKKLEGEIAIYKANILTYQRKSVGIGEHPQHLEEMDKLIDKIAQAEEKIEVLEKFEPAKGAML